MTWTEVIFEWANALELCENQINSVVELANGGFLNKLVKLLTSECQKPAYVTNNSDGVVQFVKDIYPNYVIKLYLEHHDAGATIDDCDWDEEIVMLTTLALMHFSLRTQAIGCSALRERLDTLSYSTQCAIKTFLDSFVDCPPSLVTRSMIADSIQQVSCPSTPKKKNTTRSPLKGDLNNIISSDSCKKNKFQSPFFRQSSELVKKENELKRVRLKLELALSEKTDVETEMKETVEKLRRELLVKDRELKSLAELVDQFNSKRDELTSSLSEDRLQTLRTSREEFLKQLETMHKDESDCIQMKVSVLEEELVKVRKQKHEAINQVSISNASAAEAESQVQALKVENAELLNQVEQLKNQVAKLTLTCKEQTSIIKEFNMKNHSISFETDDSLIAGVNTESLASEYSRLVLKQLEAELEAKSKDLEGKLQLESQLNTKLERLQTELFLSREMYYDLVTSSHQCIESLRDEISVRIQKEAEGQKEIEDLKYRLQEEILLRLRKDAERLKEIEELNNRLQAEDSLQQQVEEGLKEIKILKNNVHTSPSRSLKMESTLRNCMQYQQHAGDDGNRLQAEVSLRLQKDVEIEELINKLNSFTVLRKNENVTWKEALHEKTVEVENHKRIAANAKDEFEKKLFKLKRFMKDKYSEHLSNVIDNHNKEMAALKEAASKENNLLSKKLSELQSNYSRRRSRSNNCLQSDPPFWLEEHASPLRGSRSEEHFTGINNPFGDPVFEPVDSLMFKVPTSTASSSLMNSMTSLSSHLPRGPRTTARGNCLHNEDGVAVPNCRSSHFPKFKSVSKSPFGEIRAAECVIESEFMKEADSLEGFGNSRLDKMARTFSSESPNSHRLSVLQSRNSMCLPHLKSSYPLETQFLDPNRYQELEIRNSSIYPQPRSSSTPVRTPAKKVYNLTKEKARRVGLKTMSSNGTSSRTMTNLNQRTSTIKK